MIDDDPGPLYGPQRQDLVLAQPLGAGGAVRVLYGDRAVVWRYDPIVYTNLTDHGFHRRNFTQLAGALTGTILHASALVVLTGVATPEWSQRALEGTRSAYLLDTFSREAHLLIDAQAAERIGQPWRPDVDRPLQPSVESLLPVVASLRSRQLNLVRKSFVAFAL